MKKLGTLSIFLILLAFISVLSPSTIVLLCFGLLPTLVAFLLDRTTYRSVSISIAATNLASLFPFLQSIWKNVEDINDIFAGFGNLWRVFQMYIGAAIGWGIYIVVVYITRVVIYLWMRRYIARLRKAQEHMREIWGDELEEVKSFQDLAAEKAQAASLSSARTESKTQVLREV